MDSANDFLSKLPRELLNYIAIMSGDVEVFHLMMLSMPYYKRMTPDRNVMYKYYMHELDITTVGDPCSDEWDTYGDYIRNTSVRQYIG